VSEQVILPKLGFAVSEAKLAEWLIADGADVVQGQPLYSIENEKAVEEIEAPASGRLRIIAQADQTYPVGTVLGEIG
jgi:pyruvate/2-oxoglutarate dehydrogenase complex dihydrolipoamide acyltransferase (E2) component